MVEKVKKIVKLKKLKKPNPKKAQCNFGERCFIKSKFCPICGRFEVVNNG